MGVGRGNAVTGRRAGRPAESEGDQILRTVEDRRPAPRGGTATFSSAAKVGLGTGADATGWAGDTPSASTAEIGAGCVASRLRAAVVGQHESTDRRLLLAGQHVCPAPAVGLDAHDRAIGWQEQTSSPAPARAITRIAATPCRMKGCCRCKFCLACLDMHRACQEPRRPPGADLRSRVKNDLRFTPGHRSRGLHIMRFRGMIRHRD